MGELSEAFKRGRARQARASAGLLIMSGGPRVMVQGLGERLPVDRPEDCASRIITAVGAGLVGGAIMGAVTANWGNVPPVLADRPWPALKHTGISFFHFLLHLTVSTISTKDRSAGRRGSV